MPNKNYFAQLSPKQKAELFLIYTSNGIYNLDEIMNHYNSEMDRAYSSTEKDMVARMHDVNAPYLTDEDGNKMTHRMASGDGYVFPTIQRNDNGDLQSYEDTEDWGAQRAIERNDTLQFRLPSLAEYFSENYKTHLDNPVMHSDGGNLYGVGSWLKGLFKKNNTEDTQNVASDNSEQYKSYFDLTPIEEAMSGLPEYGSNKKYNKNTVSDFGDSHYNVVKARYKGLKSAMTSEGFTDEEITRLMPFLITQNILEGGWRVSKDNNNFGGMLDPETKKQLEFKTPNDFYVTYLRNLDNKWGDDYLGKGKGWRNAQTLKDYASIINREDLRLWSKERYDEYNKSHRDHPAYLYTPEWENNYTGLMSNTKFGGIQDRVSALYQLLLTNIEEWDKYAQKNKIYKN